MLVHQRVFICMVCIYIYGNTWYTMLILLYIHGIHTVYLWLYIYMGEIILIDEQDFPWAMAIPNIPGSTTRELHQPTGGLNTAQMNKRLPQYVWNTQTKPWWKCIVKFIVKCIFLFIFGAHTFGWIYDIWGMDYLFGGSVLEICWVWLRCFETEPRKKKILTVGYSSMVLPKWVSNEPQSWSIQHPSIPCWHLISVMAQLPHVWLPGLKGEYNRKPMVFTLRYGSWVSQAWWQG